MIEQILDWINPMEQIRTSLYYDACNAFLFCLVFALVDDVANFNPTNDRTTKSESCKHTFSHSYSLKHKHTQTLEQTIIHT